jgi:hypothetical protein
LEAQACRENLLQDEIPKSKSAFKSHPVYILENNVSRYNALLPGAKPVGQFQVSNVVAMFPHVLTM